MDTLAKGLKVSLQGHARHPNCSTVNGKSGKVCRSPLSSSECCKSATYSARKALVASTASVGATAEEASATVEAEQAARSDVGTSTPTAEASSSAPGASSSQDGALSNADTQGQESSQAQGDLKRMRGDSQQQRDGQRGRGKVWRDPKSMGRARQPNNDRGPRNRNKPQFMLNQSLWQSKKVQSSKKGQKVEDFPYKVGDRVVGTVVGGTNGWRVALDYNQEILGFCSIIELPHVIRDNIDSNLPWETSKVGLRREFMICGVPEELEYNGKGPLLSARLVDNDVVWGRAKQLQQVCSQDRDSIMVNVRTANKGGVLGFFEGLPLFIPWSFLPRRSDGFLGSKEELTQSFVGKDIPVTVVDVDQTLNRFVGNNIQALNIKAVSNCKIGALAWGIVNNTTNFGAFVTIDDMPSISALLHIRNISQVHVESVEDVFKIGDRVRVVIIGVDVKDNKLSLSTAELESHPGEVAQDKEKVFANAEEAVKGYREYVAQEQERLLRQKNQQAQGPIPSDVSYGSDDEDGGAQSSDELNW